ncbi:CENP-Q, a CENPA-CAD centromere complex subunit-domain-containing protein [Tricladium varicosporioides]|nr:CENP-Q, a CENPA-CAD centromere complex subunit-domain-containing protein [Hymenoscyphus varicosporioides]
MAPDENVLKRKRSRPSEWWATAPVPSHAAQQQTAPTPPKEAPKAAEMQNPSAVPIQAGAAAPKYGFRRERSKPHEWAARTTSSPTVQQNRPAPKPPRMQPAEANMPSNVNLDSQGVEPKDILKRKRSKPSEWWAASSATSSQDTPAKKDGRGSKTGVPRGMAKPMPLAENPGKSNSVFVPSKGDAAKRVPVNGKNVAKKELEAEIQQSGSPTNFIMPKRRGRPSLQNIPQEHKHSSERAKQSKSGRPPRSNAEVQSVVRNRKSETSRKQKLDENPTSQSTKQSSVDISRGSSGSDKSAQPDPPRDSQQEIGRTYSRRPNSHQQNSSMNGALPNQPIRRSTRKSETQIEIEAASSAFGRTRGPKKTVRPAVVERSGKSKEASKTDPKTAHSKAPAKHSKTNPISKKKLEPAPRVEDVGRKRKSLGKKGRNDPKRRRTREEIHEDAAENSANEIIPYQHLAPVTRKVSRHTIEEKWQPLPQSCIEHIERVLLDIQRPIVIHLKDENKRTQASTALQMVSRRLLSKISKGLPFPASTARQREDEFDFEKILDRKRVLESHLTSASDGNKLLDDNLSKELAWLESEGAALAELEANAKSEAVIMKRAERKLHPLLHSSEEAGRDGLADLDLGVVPHLSVFDVTKDVELQHIAEDLEGHMDSLHGNVHQVQGIIESVTHTKAAIQMTLFNHLNEKQFEDVILGSD